MANKFEFVKEYSDLPKSRISAIHLGATHYFTGKRCSRGHLSPRYASSSNCVECIEEKRGVVFKNFKGRSSKRSEENQRLAEKAFESGETTYQSTDPCPKGHFLRYTTSNNCAQCSQHQMKKRSERAKWARLEKLYGLSKSDYENMLKSQDFKCEICGTDISSKSHVDHCHETGVVRALLCSRCNQAIGLLGEDLKVLSSAINYIEKHHYVKRLSAKNNK